MDDAFKHAVLAPTPLPYDPNATHTLGEKLAHAVDVVKTAVIHAEEVAVDTVKKLVPHNEAPKASVAKAKKQDEADPVILTKFNDTPKTSVATNEVMAKVVDQVADKVTHETPESSN